MASPATAADVVRLAEVTPHMEKAKKAAEAAWLAIPRACYGGDTARSGKLDRARSRLYRGQILQQNMRLKALAEIYTMHSFAPF